jgi:hypothetical protein
MKEAVLMIQDSLSVLKSYTQRFSDAKQSSLKRIAWAVIKANTNLG